MARTRLDNRRPNMTMRVPVMIDHKEHILLVTVGFGPTNRPLEIFCANFKAGTALHAIVTDACILFSRLLQHGDLPSELLDSLCEPPSLLGALAASVAELEKE
jgi:hypothetical protein